MLEGGSAGREEAAELPKRSRVVREPALWKLIKERWRDPNRPAFPVVMERGEADLANSGQPSSTTGHEGDGETCDKKHEPELVKSPRAESKDVQFCT